MGPVRSVVTFRVGRKGYMGTILLVCGGRTGLDTVLPMAWGYGTSGCGRVNGTVLGCGWFIGVER